VENPWKWDSLFLGKDMKNAWKTHLHVLTFARDRGIYLGVAAPSAASEAGLLVDEGATESSSLLLSAA